MCQFTKISAGDSLCVSLKVVWGSLCPLLQAKNMNPILLAATWLTACEGSLQRLAQPSTELSQSCSKLQDTNPICCPAGTYICCSDRGDVLVCFLPAVITVVTRIGGYDGISDYNDRNCVTLTQISRTEDEYQSACHPPSPVSTFRLIYEDLHWHQLSTKTRNPPKNTLCSALVLQQGFNLFWDTLLSACMIWVSLFLRLL